jgi:branched-subunit amino acid ABC-type transport system permease component
MSDLLPFVVIGLVAGSLYGLAAAGLVLTYKTSGIFNFAHGAVGAATAYIFYDLRNWQGLPAWLAVVLSVGVAAPLGGLVLALIAARLAEAGTARRVVATIGVVLAIQGGLQLRYGIAPFPLDTPLPTDTFTVADVRVGYDQAITFVVAVVAVLALGALFRYSVLGLHMRSVVDNSELLGLAGTDQTGVQVKSWAIGSAFAGLSGLLIAPAIGLDAVLLTLVVVQAFGAAAVGRFTHLGRTFLGGLGIGVAAALLHAPEVTRNVHVLKDLPNLDTSLPFLVLFGVLVFTRGGSFTQRAVRRDVREPFRLPAPVNLALLTAATAGAIAVPHVFSTRVPVYTLGAVFIVIYASLYLLVELSNQVTLCQVAFVAIGATTFSHVTYGWGLPWGFGVLASAAVAIPIGAFVAIPAIRLSGLFLALATLGFGILVEQLVYNRDVMFGRYGQREGARPGLFGLDSDTGYFYLCLGFGVAAIALVVLIRGSRLGRLLNALADSPVALATHGASVNITRVGVFCISAALAGVGGALLVGVTGSVSSSGTSAAALVSFNSLLWLAVLSFVGRSPVLAPVLAAFVLVVLPSYFTDPNTVQLQTITFGGLAVFASTFGPTVSRWLAANAIRHAGRRGRGPVLARGHRSTIEPKILTGART